MADALEGLTNAIPVVVMGGVVMKMTESMMGTAKSATTKKVVRRTKKARSTRPARNTGFGDFSNLGF